MAVGAIFYVEMRRSAPICFIIVQRVIFLVVFPSVSVIEYESIVCLIGRVNFGQATIY